MSSRPAQYECKARPLVSGNARISLACIKIKGLKLRLKYLFGQENEFTGGLV